MKICLLIKNKNEGRIIHIRGHWLENTLNKFYSNQRKYFLSYKRDGQ